MRLRTVRSRSVKRATAPAVQGEFLNIDLEIRSRRSLAPLLNVWPWAQQPKRLSGRPAAGWLIVSPRGVPKTAEAAAKMLLGQIAKLSGAALTNWRQATTRTFDVGIRAGTASTPFEGLLKVATLKRIAAVGGQLRMTVYPAPQEGEP